MFTYEYRFYPKTFDRPEIDDFDDSMQWFISSLSKSGQILSDYQNTVKYPDYYACRVVALEMDSLDEKYGNQYTARFLNDVAELSARPPERVFVGENYDIEDCCICQSPSHYILFAMCQSYTPPILCGDCKRSVPLYKFQTTDEHVEYYDLLQWQKVYQACDRQFLNGIGERHGYKMMHHPNSFLSQEALRHCKLLEEKIGRPFYYFLFNYYRKNRPLCPKCREPWNNQEPDEIHYDFVCHNCKLVSNDV